MNKRYDELDALRGIAALIVLLSHLFFVLPGFGERLNVVAKFVFSIFWNGRSSVILFFVLSGFVLSLPLYKNVKFNYGNYLIKRISRIYLPYIAIVCLAVIAKSVLDSKIGSVPNIVNWGKWDADISFNILLSHILFLGNFNTDSFLMVIWSLVHEMRISIIFPFLILFLGKFSWKWNIILAICLSFISLLLMKRFPVDFFSTNYFITLHYTSMFIIGALVARNLNELTSKIMNIKRKIPIILLSLFLFGHPEIPFLVLNKITGGINSVTAIIIVDWVVCLSACLLILLALGSQTVSKFLLLSPIHFLGRISYSLYLIHPLVLLTIVYVFYNKVSLPIILTSSFITTLVLSWFCYRFIELPSIKLGRYLIKPKQNISKPVTNEKVS